MFTGIVTAIGDVRAVRPIGAANDMRLTIGTPWPDIGTVAIGASIACAGCCLTVVEAGGDFFVVDVSAETISRTLLGDWRPGTPVNLERAVRAGDELGGHIVSGHVDGLAELVALDECNGSLRMDFQVSRDLARLIATKGSVTLDGVSLTVNACTRDSFAINIIPHTASVTTLGRLRVGHKVHLEIDMLARYIARWQETA